MVKSKREKRLIDTLGRVLGRSQETVSEVKVSTVPPGGNKEIINSYIDSDGNLVIVTDE